MKLSKSILAAVVVGTSIVGSSVSCTKERIEKERENVEIEPVCGFGENPENNYEDCPGCGLG